ncbi:hypothetical protein H1P_4400004 [Hyella patelloides LEGE 07179]|uniref:Uncharacterized protein n=1 Tax=Hyella patelloides LEGE 07179 TaxID=945734 RepID=A0A563VY89_9CYAN|nr:hypothetical protein H1P_4400004 [Hyella patelloides LEGE 07179]
MCLVRQVLLTNSDVPFSYLLMFSNEIYIGQLRLNLFSQYKQVYAL